MCQKPLKPSHICSPFLATLLLLWKVVLCTLSYGSYFLVMSANQKLAAAVTWREQLVQPRLPKLSGAATLKVV